MRFNKVISIFIVSFSLLSSSILPSFAQSVTTENASLDEAKKVAQSFIVSHIQFNKQSPWSLGVTLDEPNLMNDFDENVSAYFFNITGQDNKNHGYIIVGADKNFVPVIEFSETTKHSIDTADAEIKSDFVKNHKQKAKKNRKLYYNYGLDYSVEMEGDKGEKVLYSLSDKITKDEKNNRKNTNKPLVNKPKEKLSDSKKSSMKKEWETLLSAQYYYGGSSIPGPKTPITNPGFYEKGYSSVSSKYLPNFYREYKLMSQYTSKPGNVCAPTAGINYMIYLKYSNPSKYDKLLPAFDQTTSAFEQLYTSMKTTSNGGTFFSNIGPGIVSYFSSKGLKLSSSDVYWWDFPVNNYCYNPFDITREIDNGRPFILAVKGNQYYSDHTLLGLGYIHYSYNVLYTSCYVQVADGWNKYPGNYVNGNLGSIDTNMIKLNP